ncbi:Arg2 protein [Candida orthopsilosis Co 90-125]|uniref:Amino-acid acetyltransferase, mitochondrial n=1 Tax=Candida orthopsilosis (strain 90-125) TaxID=1136231 RepID=H8X0B1_CANO9|nr:Arg2 protein [Candida orthopsilosis Co 90-125]CCG22623.1 Arg2 protein [Candida orthopsilosis Co 90-125]
MSKLKTLNRQFISNIETHKAVTDAKRNLILSILKSTTTKREAKNYLTKYQNQFDFSDLDFANSNEIVPLNRRENQRELFIQRFLNRQNPFVNIYDEDDRKLKKIPLRLAIFKIKFATITNQQWTGIAETFKRLINLGISPIILLDFDHLPDNSFKNNELYITDQSNKLLNRLGKPEEEDGFQVSILRSLFTKKNGHLSIDSLESILIPLYQGTIPILQPIAYNVDSNTQEFLKSDSLLFALCSALVEKRTTNLLSIEKIVMIDQLGGIPSIERNQTSHVFINLSQEYSDILSELFIGHINPKVRDLHVSNLNSMNNILSFIRDRSGNDETTGIITTPEIMSINNDQLNPIIYNVLTDRSIISSSLPSSNKRTPQVSTTIIKKGVNVQIFEQDTYTGQFTMEDLFKDKLVDKSKLVELLNDSFGKTLQVNEYFKRIDNNLATFIFVGDYDGAAIITWEKVNGDNNKRIAYLDKFAIAKRNQGLPGLADIIFKIILQSHSSELIWRSRKVNPVNKWYFERCCGCMSSPESQWKIFYTGDIFDKRIDRFKRKTIPAGVINVGEKLKEYSKICEGIPPSFK